jgi:hypothetical protein
MAILMHSACLVRSYVYPDIQYAFNSSVYRMETFKMLDTFLFLLRSIAALMLGDSEIKNFLLEHI